LIDVFFYLQEMSLMRLRIKHSNLVIAILVGLISFFTLFLTVKNIGMVWDEPAYNKAAESYANWVYIFVKDPGRALQQSTIDTYFETNHEHPPVEKVWSGVVWYAARKFSDQLSAFRTGPMISSALLMALLFLIVSEKYGKAAGLFASAALLSLPRFFFHAHLATLDVPVTVACFATTYVFWKTIDRKGWAWGVLCGLVWGVAVAVKLNGVFVFFSILIWVLIFRRTWRSIIRLVVMGLTALVTFFIAWPWLYHDTWARVLGYINFHVNHYKIGTWYLGQFYLPPPWHAVFVITWAVLPLAITLLAVIGISRAKKGSQDGGLVWLLIISSIVTVLPFATGKTLLYDGERLFMPLFPNLAALAGIGFSWLSQKIKTLVSKQPTTHLSALGTPLLGIVLLLPSILGIIKYYPHLLSYYSESVGGLKGATRMGLETTYWCETYPEAFAILNSQAKEHAVLWAECDTIRDYKRFGVLRSDIECRDAFTPDADWFLLQYRQSQYLYGGETNYAPSQLLKGQTPVKEVDIDGIPLLKLYGAVK
jgi:4-amino-4-deoxy-L-arabinose transferase-like glycosyltransferase